MSVRFLVVSVALVACRGDVLPEPVVRAPPLDTGSLPTDETGTVPEPTPSFEADCALDPENALRALCTVEISPPGAVEIAFAPEGGGETRVARSETVAGTHRLTLYGMTAWTTYTWEARAVGGEAAVWGSFAIGDPPSGLDLTLSATGTPSFPYLLVPDYCGGTPRAVIVRTSDGRPVWYEDLSEGLPNSGWNLEVVGLTEDGTVLGLTNGGAIVETTMTGERRLVLRRTVDFEDPTHHDVWRRDGYTYALFAETVEQGSTDWIVDGFLVFDADGEQVARWRIADHVALPDQGPPGPIDYTHANAVWTDAAGDVYLSIRHLNAVLKVEGDLGSPRFGEVLWTLVGSPSDLASDFALTASTSAVNGKVSFQQQHNAHLLPNGRLAVFDNRQDPEEPSRVLQVALDEAGGRADIVGAWELDQHCPFHGGAWHTAGGNPVATCGPMSTVYEFDGGTAGGAPRWRAELGCGGAPGGASIPRAVPLDALP